MKKISTITLLILFFCALTLQGAEKNMDQLVDEYLSTYQKLGKFSGTVLVAKEGNVVFNKSYGFACEEHSVPNDSNTKYRIGSLTKSFTAAAILQLEQHGLLSLDDPLGKYLENYPRGEEILIKHLLSHTSGIPDHTELPGYDTDRRVYPVKIEDTIATFKGKELEFTPGSKFKYSNSGYILLGCIVEKVSGKDYATYIRESLLEPNGLSNSGFEEGLAVIPSYAHGYSRDGSKLIRAKYRNINNTQASGGLYSTVEDLYKWDRVLRSDELLSQEVKDRHYSIENAPYSCGWGIAELFGRRMLGHNGETDGYKSTIMRFVDDDVCVIVLSNQEATPIGKLAVDLSAIVFGKSYTVPTLPENQNTDVCILKKYEGFYELKPGFVFHISRDGNQLFCQATGQGKLTLTPITETKFQVVEVNASIEFKIDGEGKVFALVLAQGGREFTAKRTEQS